MSSIVASKDDPPTYEEATSDSVPPPPFQQAIDPQGQNAEQPPAAPQPQRTQVPLAFYQVPYSTFDYSSSLPCNALAPGLNPLQSMQKLIVSTKRGNVFKVKNINRELIYTAKTIGKGDCCAACCDPSASWIEVQLRDLSKNPLVIAEDVQEECTCCDFAQRSIKVSNLNGSVIGHVKRIDYYKFEISNPGGDVVFIVQGKSSFWRTKPFRICYPGGHEVGLIERKESVKNQITFPSDLDIRQKVMILMTAIHIQNTEEDSRNQ